ncbi:MAG: nucleotidyl transferase AbiEii/AbiGii toxin family protein [Chlamydiota bacterium]|nr:nucleotidyl transferase AbiEii/AbiGii toxin family protein [Chlamydiota bacterium]
MADKSFFKEDILLLAKWVLECPMIREHYALGGGAWLTLRLPKMARISRDVDVFSSKEEISSYKAMMEIVALCKKGKIPYRITRRGQHFCQLFVSYPKKSEIKIDIGKIWHPIKLIVDPDLHCPILSPTDMILEKLQCIVDRIEPTDLYDLCRLHEAYPNEFEKSLKRLSKTEEVSELLIRIQRCLEATDGVGTKESLNLKEKKWMESYISKIIHKITFLIKKLGL